MMIRGYKFLTLILLSFFLSLLFFLITPSASYAAGLNASEQELVAKAKGTFEWNGKKYRAKQTYLDQLTAYLSRDDVDLSADTCAAAAKEMYGSVERGVMEGYLYEVNSNSSGKQSDGDPVTASETASQEEKSAEQESPSEEILEEKESASVVFQVPRGIVPDEGWNHKYETDIGQTGEAGLTEPGSWLSLLNPSFYRLLMIFESVCTVLLSMALAVTVRGRRLRHRRKIRKVMQTAVIFMTAAACLLSGMYAALRVGTFSEQAVMNQIEKTSWYQTVYDDMKRETVMTMYLAGVPENKLENSKVEDTVKYSNVVLTARQYMKAEIEGDSQTPVLSGVFETFRTSVMEYYEKKDPGSEAVRTGVRNLLEGLEARCVKQMNWAGMEWWRGKTQGFLLWFPALMGGAVLVAGLGTAELICLSRSSYRAVKRIGGSLAGGFISLVNIGLLIGRFGGTGTAWAKPSYMKEFVRNMSVQAAYSVLMIGIMGCCLAVMTFYISRCIKYQR